MSELRLDRMETQDVEEEMAQGLGLRGKQRGDGERGGGHGRRRGVQGLPGSPPAAPASTREPVAHAASHLQALTWLGLQQEPLSSTQTAATPSPFKTLLF